MIAIPAHVREVLERLWEAGFEAYPVGGCVRDVLLGKTPQDWDICTAARPEQTRAVFADRRVIETGMKHGTVTVITDGRPVEITTFRVEADYGDRRHPDSVAFVQSLREDLARRDFTVNAMAFDADGGVIDPFGGQEDLARGVIRCVGEPEERFREDALRILRGLRFAARLDFRIEERTAEALRDNRALLNDISRERFFSELKGLLCGTGAGEVLRAFPEVIFTVIPELAAEYGFEQNSPHHIHDIWTHTTMAVDAIAPEPALRLTMLLHDVGKPEKYFTDENDVGHFYGHAEAGAVKADAILRRLRCDNDTREAVTLRIRYHDIEPPQTKKGVRRLVVKLGEPTVRDLIACWKADSADRAAPVRKRNLAFIGVTEGLLDELMAQESCFSLRDLAVDGSDMLELGMEPGPALGDTLRELFRMVTEEGVPNEKETLLRYVKKP